MNNHSEHTVNTELLAKYFSNEATLGEIELIENWKNSSEKNKKNFNEFSLVWLDTGTLKNKLDSSIQINTDLAWNKFQTKIGKNKTIKLNTSFNWRYTLRIAAFVAIALGSFWYLNSDNTFPKENQLLASNEIVNFTFSDSSKIVLNENSQITYPDEFSNKERKVKLSGEAHFSITPDKEKPFVIEVNNALVKVLGTSFVVKEIKSDSLIKVRVETGTVLFSYKDESVILTKGMSASLDLRTEKIGVGSKSDVNIGAWKSRKLLFKSTPLKEVINQIEDLYEVTIEIENSVILNCELSVTFDNETLDDVLMIIESTFGFEIDSSNNKILIKGNGC
jgi:ferric-dicitrate binding protein FerR (iron transport regulator)